LVTLGGRAGGRWHAGSDQPGRQASRGVGWACIPSVPVQVIPAWGSCRVKFSNQCGGHFPGPGAHLGHPWRPCWGPLACRERPTWAAGITGGWLGMHTKCLCSSDPRMGVVQGQGVGGRAGPTSAQHLQMLAPSKVSDSTYPLLWCRCQPRLNGVGLTMWERHWYGSSTHNHHGMSVSTTCSVEHRLLNGCPSWSPLAAVLGAAGMPGATNLGGRHHGGLVGHAYQVSLLK
jgi:hypothetical protein